MGGFEFKVNDPLKFQFRIVGGASPTPEPSPESAGIITGVPVAVSGGAMGTAALTGNVEEE